MLFPLMGFKSALKNKHTFDLSTNVIALEENIFNDLLIHHNKSRDRGSPKKVYASAAASATGHGKNTMIVTGHGATSATGCGYHEFGFLGDPAKCPWLDDPRSIKGHLINLFSKPNVA